MLKIVEFSDNPIDFILKINSKLLFESKKYEKLIFFTSVMYIKTVCHSIKKGISFFDEDYVLHLAFVRDKNYSENKFVNEFLFLKSVITNLSIENVAYFDEFPFRVKIFDYHQTKGTKFRRLFRRRRCFYRKYPDNKSKHSLKIIPKDPKESLTYYIPVSDKNAFYTFKDVIKIISNNKLDYEQKYLIYGYLTCMWHSEYISKVDFEDIEKKLNLPNFDKQEIIIDLWSGVIN